MACGSLVADGLNFVGVAPNSVGLNALYLNNANFAGRRRAAAQRAAVPHRGACGHPWLSENPTAGTVRRATAPWSRDLRLDRLTPRLLRQPDHRQRRPDTPEVAIPVTLTVLEPATIAA